MAKTLIFDIDGTLVKLPVDWCRVLKELKKITGKEYLGILAILQDYYGKPLYEEIDKLVEEYEVKAINNLIIYDNAPEILRELSSRYRIVFVTMQSRLVAEKIIDVMGVRDLAELIVSRREASTRYKQIKYVIDHLGIDPWETVFIGDKILDVIASLMNSVISILVVRNIVSRFFTETDDILEDLEALGIPLIRSLRELPKLLAIIDRTYS